MTRFLCRSCTTSSLLLPGEKKKKTNTMSSGSAGSGRRNAKSVVRREEEKREEEMMKSSWTTASPLVTAERRKRKTKKNKVFVVRNGIMDNKNNASTGSSFYDPFERSKFQKIGDEIDRRMFFPGGNGDDASTSASSSSSPFFGLEEEFAKLDRELSDARERALLVGTEGRRRRSAGEDFGPNKTVSKEISREHRGRHSYSNFRYAESVTTYGPSPPAAALVGRGSRQSLVDAPTLGLLLALGTTYVYFKEKTTFARNFSATNFKEEEKEKLAREWPVLYLSSEAFRREFRKAKEKEEKREREKETRDEGKDDDDRKR